MYPPRNITQYAHSNISIISIYMCLTKVQALHSCFILSIDFLTIILLCQRYMQKTLYTAFYFQSATLLPDLPLCSSDVTALLQKGDCNGHITPK